MAEERDKKGIQRNYEKRREKYDDSRTRAKAKARTEYKHLDRELNNIICLCDSLTEQHRQCHAASVCC